MGNYDYKNWKIWIILLTLLFVFFQIQQIFYSEKQLDWKKNFFYNLAMSFNAKDIFSGFFKKNLGNQWQVRRHFFLIFFFLDFTWLGKVWKRLVLNDMIVFIFCVFYSMLNLDSLNVTSIMTCGMIDVTISCLHLNPLQWQSWHFKPATAAWLSCLAQFILRKPSFKPQDIQILFHRPKQHLNKHWQTENLKKNNKKTLK